MTNADKNILITPNIGQTAKPKIDFTGFDNEPMTLTVLDDNSLSIDGYQGQLFSVGHNLTTGTIFSVNDVSGIPSIEVDADGTVKLAEFDGYVGIGASVPNSLLTVDGVVALSHTLYPSPTAGYSKLYAKTDGYIYLMRDDGAEFNLAASGGGGGGGNVSNTGTPVNNQIAVWTNATTIEGDTSLTWDGSLLTTGRTRIAIDGAVSTPALHFGATADADTGFWHPAANTIAISAGSTEVMRWGTSEILASGGADFRFTSATRSYMFFIDSGNDVVAVNTASPVSTARFHVSDSGGSIAAALTDGNETSILSANTDPFSSAIIGASNTAANHPVLRAVRARNILSTPGAVNSNDSTFSLIGGVYDGTAVQETAAIEFEATTNASSGTAPQRIVLSTGATNTASRAARLTINSDGTVINAGTLYPDTNNNYDFGTSGVGYRTLYIANIDNTFQTSHIELRSSIIPNSNAAYRLGDYSASFSDGYFDSVWLDLAGPSVEVDGYITKDLLSGHIETAANKTYYVANYINYYGRITDVVTQSASGTATGTTRINGTALGGTANSISATEQIQSHTTSNAFKPGDEITFVITSNSSALDVRYSILIDREGWPN